MRDESPAQPRGEELRRPVPAPLRRARWATATTFLLTGLVFATWAARIPARKAELGLTDGQRALAFMALNAGAVLGLQLGAVVVTRIGSRSGLSVSAHPPGCGGVLRFPGPVVPHGDLRWVDATKRRPEQRAERIAE